MVRMASIVLGISLASAACGDDPTGMRVPASIDIGPSSVQVGYLDTVTLALSVADAEGEAVSEPAVTWTTSRPGIVTVSDAGVITTLWPGQTMVYAAAGELMDSVAVVVHTESGGDDADCGQTWISYPGHGFYPMFFHPGSLNGNSVAPYRGETLFWGSGIMFGTSADDLRQGGNSLSLSDDFFLRGSCYVNEADAIHSVALLQSPLHFPGPGQARNLTVVQEGFAFTNALDDDYALVRYTFTNDGPFVVTGIRVAVLADFDVNGPDVGTFNAATAVADVTAADSLTHTLVGGFAIIGGGDVSYRTTFPHPGGGGTPATCCRTRADFFDYLVAGSDGSLRTEQADVRQLIGAEPFDLQPGASKSMWYAVAGGLNRAEFQTHIARAIAATEFLEPSSHQPAGGLVSNQMRMTRTGTLE